MESLDAACPVLEDVLANVINTVNIPPTVEWAEAATNPFTFSPQSTARLEAALFEVDHQTVDAQKEASTKLGVPLKAKRCRTTKTSSASNKVMKVKQTKPPISTESDSSAPSAQKSKKDNTLPPAKAISATKRIDSLKLSQQIVAEVLDDWLRYQADDLESSKGVSEQVRMGVTKHLMMMKIEQDLLSKHDINKFSISLDQLSQSIAACIAHNLALR